MSEALVERLVAASVRACLGGRGAGALVLAVLHLTGCAQDLGFIDERWPGAPGAQRILLLPANFDATPPNYLAAGITRVTESVAARIAASNREVVQLRMSVAIHAVRRSVDQLGLKGTYQPDVARPHLAAGLAREHHADLVLMPYVVVRDAAIDDDWIVWDGTRSLLIDPGIPIEWGLWSGKNIALSVRILAFDSRGRWIMDAYGGIESAYSFQPTAEGFELGLRNGLLEDADAIRAAVDRALATLLGPAERQASSTNERDSNGKARVQWRRVRTGPFVIMSNAPPRTVRSIARQAVQFVSVAEQVTGRRLEARPPVEILAFGPGPEFGRLHEKHVLGAALATVTGTRIAISTDKAWLRTSTLYHELVHVLLFQDRSFSYPSWYHEGLAEFLGAVSIQGDLASLHLIPAHRREILLQRSSLPLELLLSRRSFADLPPVAVDSYYTDAWAFVFFLHTSHLNGGEDHREHLSNMLERLSRGEEWRTALESSFERPVEKLEQEYSAFRRGLTARRPPLHRYRVEAVEPLPELEFMPSAEMHIALGYYALSLGGRSLGRAFDHFGLAGGRMSAAGAIGRARAWIRAGEIEQARAELSSLELDPSAPEHAALEETWAELLMTAYSAAAEMQEDPDVDLLRRARARLEPVAEKWPERGSAWRLLGSTYVLDSTAPVDRGIEVLERAQELLPSLLEIQLDLGELLVRRGDVDSARRRMSRALASHDRRLVERARHRLEALASEDRPRGRASPSVESR